jgi:Holliday junction resolvase RusA-like endonuclease
MAVSQIPNMDVVDLTTNSDNDADDADDNDADDKGGGYAPGEQIVLQTHSGRHRTKDLPPPGLKVCVHGQPKALPRMRHFRNGLHNPANGQAAAFKAAAQAASHRAANGPIYEKGVAVAVTLTFHMRRPNSDFIRGQRLVERLRNCVPLVRPTRPDIDNLSKFVLDALNGLAYHDDSQVVKLVACKLVDTEDDCGGRTEIEVAAFPMGSQFTHSR